VLSEEQGRDIAKLVIDEMHRIDSGMNPWGVNRKFAKLSREAPLSPVVVSIELFSLIEKLLHYSQLSNGASDISFASLGQFYDFKKGRKPTDKEFEAFRGTVNFRNIILDSTAVTIFFSSEKLLIDLGGIAKGYAVDRAVDILQRNGIQSAIVSAGGDSRVIGKRERRPWVIGIKHSRRNSEQVV
jgi:thiamine biosynthesis lipoprotein